MSQAKTRTALARHSKATHSLLSGLLSKDKEPVNSNDGPGREVFWGTGSRRKLTSPFSETEWTKENASGQLDPPLSLSTWRPRVGSQALLRSRSRLRSLSPSGHPYSNCGKAEIGRSGYPTMLFFYDFLPRSPPAAVPNHRAAGEGTESRHAAPTSLLLSLKTYGLDSFLPAVFHLFTDSDSSSPAF